MRITRTTLFKRVLQRPTFRLGALFAFLLIGAVYLNSFAFTGPSNPGGTGSGAIGSDSNNNLSIGSSTTSNTTKLLIVASSTNSGEYALRIVQPGLGPILVIRNDGNIGIGTSTPASTLTVNGNIYSTGSFSGTISAGNVSSGQFGLNTGGGNYTFPANIGAGISSLSPWTANTSAIESLDTSIFFGTDTDLHLNSNAYYNAGWKYKTTDLAANYYMYKGDHSWRVAPSGAADSAITWTNAMVLKNNGNLAIGTSTPTSPAGFASLVHLRGAANASYVVDGGGSYRGEFGVSSAGGWVSTADSIPLRFITVNVERMRIASSGLVGIGNTTPSDRLSVYTTKTSTATATPDSINLGGTYSNAAGTNLKLKMYDDGTLTGGFGISVGQMDYRVWQSTARHVFYQGTTELMRIQGDGNVGIGTTNPVFDANTAKYLTLDGGSGVIGSIGTGGGTSGTGIAISQLAFLNTALSTTDKRIATVIGSTDTSSSTGKLNFYVWSGSGSPISRMTILGNGNVGINATSPTSTLTVVGEIKSTTGGVRFPDGTLQTTAASGSGLSGGVLNTIPIWTSSTAIGNSIITQPNGSSVAIGSGGFAVGTTTAQSIGNIYTTGVITGSSFSGTLSSGNVSSGAFGANTGGGNYTFPGTLGASGIITSSGASANIGAHPTYGTGYASFWRTGSDYAILASATDLFVNSPSAGTIFFRHNNVDAMTLAGTTLTVGGGAGKIDVGTVDPIYTINGRRFATYGAEMTGVKGETTGVGELACNGVNCKTTIDFNKAQEGSNLWLFAKTTDLKRHFDDLTVLLTPAFDGRVWYEKDVAGNRLTIHAAPNSKVSKLEFSYRLTAPRFDAAQWPNTSDSFETGFVINDQR